MRLEKIKSCILNDLGYIVRLEKKNGSKKHFKRMSNRSSFFCAQTHVCIETDFSASFEQYKESFDRMNLWKIEYGESMIRRRTMNQNFQWVDFYTELASALLPYRSKRAELLGILKQIFQDAGMKYPFREKGEYDYEDICPFTIFACFNKRMKDSNRSALLERFAKEFSIRASVPESFPGIPVLMPQNAWFFAYKENRGG